MIYEANIALVATVMQSCEESGNNYVHIRKI